MPNDKANDHDIQLETIDALPSKELILTAGKDKIVKIWNSKKELLREIKFTDEIISAQFLNGKADIVIAHSGKLSIIYAVDY